MNPRASPVSVTSSSTCSSLARDGSRHRKRWQHQSRARVEGERGGAQDMVGAALAAWPQGRPAAFSPAVPLPVGTQVRLLTKPTEQAHIVFGTRSVDYHHPDRFALDLMNCVLGEGMSCRLFLEIRERLGLCYDIHSWTGRLADTGSARVYPRTEPRRVEEAVP